MAKKFTSTHELSAVEKIKLKNIDAHSVAELTKNSENGFALGNVKSITIISDDNTADNEVSEIAIFECENSDGNTEYYLVSSAVVIDTISDIIADIEEDESLLTEFVFYFSYGVSKTGNRYLTVKVK